VLCHLANISYRLGADRPFADAAGRFGRNSEEADAFERMREHLAEGNGLKLEGTPYRLGRRLEFDAASERFANDVEADRLLTRDYRKPFVVPERIT